MKKAKRFLRATAAWVMLTPLGVLTGLVLLGQWLDEGLGDGFRKPQWRWPKRLCAAALRVAPEDTFPTEKECRDALAHGAPQRAGAGMGHRD